MNKIKGAFADITNRLQSKQANDGEPNINDDSGSITSRARIAWPPKLVKAPQVLGEVIDASGRQYPRDLGRSVHLGGHHYYMFGDTFCFDNKGSFEGVTNNTIALIPALHKPTKSEYQCSFPKITEFVPYTPEEKAFCDNDENKKENIRLVNWTFGGIVEKPHSHGREGWLFYDQVETHGGNPVQQNGIGIAEAEVTGHHGEIRCERIVPFPLFPGDGPLWGNISNISAHDGWTYLLSGQGLDNYMARIRTDADFTKASNYRFLKKSGEWASSYSPPFGPFGELAHDILAGQGQGAINYIPDHCPEGKPYLWIGCEKFPTSQLCIAVAVRPEGPWEVHKLGEMPKITEHAKTRYCIYPHLWGSELKKGELLISWSDDGTMGGKVAAGRFTLAMA